MNDEHSIVPGNVLAFGKGPWRIYLNAHFQFVLGVGFHRLPMLGTHFTSIVIWLGPLCVNFEHHVEGKTE